MSKVRILLTFFCMFFLVQGLNAQAKKPEAMAGISRAYYSMFDARNPLSLIHI